MNLEKAKSLFLKTLIACLIASAGIAVVTVILGSFNEILGRALGTLCIIAVHSLISMVFIDNNQKQKTFDNLAFFTDTTFALIILSFITSIFGVWGILAGSIVLKLYALYGVLLFAVLHGEVLAKTIGKQKNIDNVVYSNYVFMVAVVLMLLPVIFLTDNSTLGSMYYRLLAAAGIIDATLTLIAVILHKLYIQKYPQTVDPVFNLPGQPGTMQPKRHVNAFVVILVGLLALQIVASISVALIGAATRR